MAMHRRSAGVGLARRRGRTVHDAPGSATYQSILGANLVAMWHSQLGIALVSGKVDTWTDQIGGVVLQAPAAATRPLYQADGTAFGGKSVVYGTIVDLSYLRNLALPAGLLPVGSTPWMFWVWRIRTIGTKNIFDIESAAAVQLNVYMNASNDLRLFATGADRVTLAPFSTGRQAVSSYIDGANAKINVDGSITSGAYASTTTAVATKLAVNAATSGSLPGDQSFALGLLCVTPPSAAQETAIRALALAEFPP